MLNPYPASSSHTEATPVASTRSPAALGIAGAGSEYAGAQGGGMLTAFDGAGK
ncbi:hypothetical protein [Actinospica robiniae]|uniref:hypothetical protein n=1 Tax=Actinospica robiniae TaxID=304901 RepID=UPI0003F8DA38|nr:hypothetical protein [Actinospica robiniae]